MQDCCHIDVKIIEKATFSRKFYSALNVSKGQKCRWVQVVAGSPKRLECQSRGLTNRNNPVLTLNSEQKQKLIRKQRK